MTNSTPTVTCETGKRSKLPNQWAPSSFDVICGRGSIAQQNEGNRRLKALVNSMLSEYNASKCKFQKSKLVSSIVERVQRATPEGGFVKFVDDGWVRVSDRHCREKVGQMFRDALHTKYKSSTKAKSQLRSKRSVGSKQEEEGSPDSSVFGGWVDTNQATMALHGLLNQPLQIPSSITCLQRVPDPPSPVLSKSQKLPSNDRAISFLELNNLPNFEPEPIVEDSLERLFDLDFSSREVPLWTNLSEI